MTVRYIGSKARVASLILDIVGKPTPSGYFVDAFCGTGAVAEEAARRGWPVRVNDHLYCAVVITHARLTSLWSAQFERLGGYREAIGQLNTLDAASGFVWREYSPASRSLVGTERRYFTEENAGKIDAIRKQIRVWSERGEIDSNEEAVLLADLLSAASRVANIAGTFGCFLRHWTGTARQPLTLKPRSLFKGPIQVEAFNVDVFSTPTDHDDIAYLDPPYTKRQYAAYYHILETIAVGDQPNVGGITGLRPWREKSSSFCFKVRALQSIAELVGSLNARRIVLSYSSEGHVELDDLLMELGRLGDVTLHALGGVGRYRPNQVASSAGSHVEEFLLDISKVDSLELATAI